MNRAARTNNNPSASRSRADQGGTGSSRRGRFRAQPAGRQGASGSSNGGGRGGRGGRGAGAPGGEFAVPVTL
ncbi:ATP-dependent helicase, partial [Streptomyces sp. NPDC005574]